MECAVALLLQPEKDTRGSVTLQHADATEPYELSTMLEVFDTKEVGMYLEYVPSCKPSALRHHAASCVFFVSHVCSA